MEAITNNYLTLSKLNKLIREVISEKFKLSTFWVITDITNHTFNGGKNYHHFELIEKDLVSNKVIAKISGKAWGNGSRKIEVFEKTTGQKFTDNIHVLICVQVNYHEVFGLHLDLVDIDTSFTIGNLEKQRLQTLEKLVLNNSFINKIGANYITKNNQLPLPLVIQRIALVSSQTSAGAEDFKHTLLNNSYNYKFIIDDYYTPVQGESNSGQLLKRIVDVFTSKIPYDIVVITRGGGSQSDFLIFDGYYVGLAVAKFPIPIITGIGHQKNETIVDLMAHTSTKTPTKAAEFIVSHNRFFEDSILGLQKNILIKTQQVFSLHSQRLSNLNTLISNTTRNIISIFKDELIRINQITINTTKTLIYTKKSLLLNLSTSLITKPKIILYNRINDIKNTTNNIKNFNSKYIKNQKASLGHYVSIIRLMSPSNILKKGFAIIKVEDKIIANPADVNPGSQIKIILQSTEIQATVNTKSKYNGTEINL